jgi:hypothetical protein
MQTTPEQLDPLLKRMQFEERIVRLPLDGSVRVALANDGKTARFQQAQQVLVAKVERPLIHQLGSRLWDTQDYGQIQKNWHSMPADQLERALALVFKNHDLVARYFADVNGVNRVYGLVTPHFVDINPLNFREQFIEQVRQSTSLAVRSNGLVSLRSGDVMEWFDFHSTGFQTEYKYGLYYARNSGYDAYKVFWGREIIICTNQLKSWDGTVLRWKHTREMALEKFIDDTIQEGLGNQQWLEQRINAARSGQLAQSQFEELMARLSLATASKERIQNRLDIEAHDVGRNEWALSQALTWLGSHDRHIAIWSKQHLTTLGTEVLEKGLPQVLTTEARIKTDGMYGILLPDRRKLLL